MLHEYEFEIDCDEENWFSFIYRIIGWWTIRCGWSWVSLASYSFSGWWFPCWPLTPPASNTSVLEWPSSWSSSSCTWTATPGRRWWRWFRMLWTGSTQSLTITILLTFNWLHVFLTHAGRPLSVPFIPPIPVGSGVLSWDRLGLLGVRYILLLLVDGVCCPLPLPLGLLSHYCQQEETDKNHLFHEIIK